MKQLLSLSGMVFRESGLLQAARPSPPLKVYPPEAILMPCHAVACLYLARLATSEPSTTTPLTGAFTTPLLLELGGQATPPGGCHARHTASMAHSSIPPHFLRARASLHPVLCPSTTIIGALCCTAHGSC